MLHAAVMGAGLMLGAAAALLGQTPAEQARLDRLARRYDDLAAQVSRVVEVGATRIDSVRLAGVWIFSDSIESPVFRRAGESFRRQLLDRLGENGLPLLADARIVVRFGEPDPSWGRLVTGDTQFIGVQQRRRTARWLTDQLTHAVDRQLARRAGASIAAWRADVRLFQDPGPLLEATYLELLTSNLPTAQGCYGGRLGSCAHALDLIPSQPEGSAEAGAEMQRFVERQLRHRAAEQGLAPLYAACMQRDDGPACLTLLDRAGVPEPTLSTRAAGTLLLTVGDVGGSSALARFFTDTLSAIVPRFEAATGMPLDSLLAQWRESVLAHRPAPTAVPAAMQWVVLGWATVLVGLATRSTRWR